jgi:hypothetical protein
MSSGDAHGSSRMKVPLRGLLARLTTIALTTGALGTASAAPCDLDELTDPEIDRECVETEDAALALGRGLALALGEMRPLAATQLAATWSTSPDDLRRLALANALEWRFKLVGDALVIDQLSRDADPAIRAAAARAAWIRRASGGDLGVLDRLADDPDPQVRSVALAAR